MLNILPGGDKLTFCLIPFQSLGLSSLLEVYGGASILFFYSKAGFLGSIYFKQKSVQSSSELQIKEDAHRQRGTSNPGHTGDLFIKKVTSGLFLTVIPVLKHFNALYPNCDENRAPVMHRLPPPLM